MGTVAQSARAKGSHEQWVYRAGGLAALASAVAYIVIIGLYALAAAPPTGREAWLT